MNSCFPPLSALSLGDNNKSSGAANGGTAIDGSANLKNKKKSYWGSNSSLRKLSVASAVKERKSSSNCNGGAVNLNATTNGKIEVLQDLDLYYIKQIAHNLKVSFAALVLIVLYLFAVFFHRNFKFFISNTTNLHSPILGQFFYKTIYRCVETINRKTKIDGNWSNECNNKIIIGINKIIPQL